MIALRMRFSNFCCRCFRWNSLFRPKIAKILRKTDKVFLVVNKVDKNTMIKDSLEFYSLGFEKIYSLSAINGLGQEIFLMTIKDLHIIVNYLI